MAEDGGTEMKNERTLERPTHRAIIDRRTGRDGVGQPAPIHPDDWPYGELSPSEQLWRYMDFWKFEDLRRSSACIFLDRTNSQIRSRAGFLMGIRPRLRSDAAFNATYRIAATGKELEASQSIVRCCVYVSCWQRSKAETREMWEAYTTGSESVAISTSAKALYTFVPEQIMKSPVKYHADDFPRTEFGHTAIFFLQTEGLQFRARVSNAARARRRRFDRSG